MTRMMLKNVSFGSLIVRVGWASLFSPIGLFAVGSVIACSTTPAEEVGGETHWVTCEVDADCNSERSCVCQLCTSACESDADCSELGSNARCEAAARTNFDGACQQEQVERLCVLPTMVEEEGESSEVTASEVTASDTAESSEPGEATTGDPGTDDVTDTDFTAPPDPTVNVPNDPVGCIGEAAATNPECATCEARSNAEYALIEQLASDSTFLSCTEDSDCVFIEPKTSCTTFCETSIAVTEVEAFSAAVQNIADQYCDAPGFVKDCSSSCSRPDGARVAVCDQGACRAEEEAPTVIFELVGRPFNAALDCFGETSIAGEASCASDDDAETVALSPSGECWWFPSTCVPDGFTPAIESDTCVGVSTLCSEISNPCPEVGADEGEGACVPPACEALGLDACLDDSTCMVASASAYNTDNSCFETTLTPLVCTTARDCDQGETITIAADGSCWLFPSCPPDAFRIATVGECTDSFNRCEETACDSRDLASCDDGGEGPCAVAQAHPYDIDRNCYYPEQNEPLACHDVSAGCGDAETLAVGPDGACWVFPDTCLPPGYHLPAQGECGEELLDPCDL
jgi:hypothetical protein